VRATTAEPLPPGLEKELQLLTEALQRDVGVAVTAVRPMAGVLHASMKDGVLVIPAQHVGHWNRFGVIPTALVRDVAYACKKQQLRGHGGMSNAQVEADSMAYAERFLRAATDGLDDGDLR
jgi:hypothetical protein